jgi:basic amino acid/polyamine antiporter, APA family
MTAQNEFQRPQLHKGIGKAGMFSLAFGAMIGVGWVTAMGSWLSNAGPLGAIIAFVLGGLLMLAIGLCYAEVTSALPLSGGEVAYAYKAYGTSKAFIVGWFLVFGYLSVSAFEAISISKVISYLIPFRRLRKKPRKLFLLKPLGCSFPCPSWQPFVFTSS